MIHKVDFFILFNTTEITSKAKFNLKYLSFFLFLRIFYERNEDANYVVFSNTYTVYTGLITKSGRNQGSPVLQRAWGHLRWPLHRPWERPTSWHPWPSPAGCSRWCWPQRRRRDGRCRLLGRSKSPGANQKQNKITLLLIDHCEHNLLFLNSRCLRLSWDCLKVWIMLCYVFRCYVIILAPRTMVWKGCCQGRLLSHVPEINRESQVLPSIHVSSC